MNWCGHGYGLCDCLCIHGILLLNFLGQRSGTDWYCSPHQRRTRTGLSSKGLHQCINSPDILLHRRVAFCHHCLARVVIVLTLQSKLAMCCYLKGEAQSGLCEGIFILMIPGRRLGWAAITLSTCVRRY